MGPPGRGESPPLRKKKSHKQLPVLLLARIFSRSSYPRCGGFTRTAPRLEPAEEARPVRAHKVNGSRQGDVKKYGWCNRRSG